VVAVCAGAKNTATDEASNTYYNNTAVRCASCMLKSDKTIEYLTELMVNKNSKVKSLNRQRCSC